MSKLNINRNIFLEKEELLRFQEFMLESPLNQVFLKNSIKYGIIDTSGGGESLDFKIEEGTGSGTIKIANKSIALDKDGLLITQSVIDNVSIPNDGKWHWFYIEHKYSNLEEGTISINSSGIISGNNTKFTEVLRGSGSEVPVKIKLISSNNPSIYEVLDVINDTNIILQGESFVVESGINYYVLGSTPLGETVTSEQEEGLYNYDSCNLVRVTGSADNGISPLSLVEGKQFFLGIVLNSGGAISILDGRTNSYWEYFIRGISDKLDKNNNLSDIVSPESARANLGDLLTRTQIENLLNIDKTNWLSMTLGSKLNTNSSIKIKREGNIVTITGEFRITASLSTNETIASIAYSSIGLKSAPGTTIYFQTAIIDERDNHTDYKTNHGIFMYVQYYSGAEDTLFVKVGEDTYTPTLTIGKKFQFTITYIGG